MKSSVPNVGKTPDLAKRFGNDCVSCLLSLAATATGRLRNS
jgi:hypothetical protein